MLQLWRVMRVAVPICRGRVSPVLDVAQCVSLVEVENGAAVGRSEHPVGGDRIGEIGELGVRVLICGGLSLELEKGLWAHGIEVVAGICGSVDDVICAYLAGRLGERRFVMPGWVHGRGSRWMGERQGKAEKGAPQRPSSRK